METYDQQFAQAMKLKLQRNRQALKASGVSAPRSEPSGPRGDFRDGLIQEILAERPGLTRQELDRDMRLMGY
jgi:hypothetical protein